MDGGATTRAFSRFRVIFATMSWICEMEGMDTKEE